MTFRGIRARWFALVGAALAVVAVTTAVLAQPQPQYRFYGLPGDSTINGEIAPVGSIVAASSGGEVLGSVEIGEAGTWYIDVEPDSANITFSLNGINDNVAYDAETVGGSRKIELHVTSSVPDDAMQSEPADGDMLEAEEDDGAMMEAADEDAMESSEAEDDGDLMEAEDDTMQTASDGDGEEDYPDSGSGGLLEQQGANWPLAVGVTAALMAAVAGAALVISRRTDGAS